MNGESHVLNELGRGNPPKTWHGTWGCCEKINWVLKPNCVFLRFIKRNLCKGISTVRTVFTLELTKKQKITVPLNWEKKPSSNEVSSKVSNSEWAICKTQWRLWDGFSQCGWWSYRKVFSVIGSIVQYGLESIW